MSFPLNFDTRAARRGRVVRHCRLLWLAALAALPLTAAAASRVEAFSADTWTRLSRPAARPTAVVFSTSDCAHCPGVIRDLARDARQAVRPPKIVVVVIDGAGQEAALLADASYRDADTLYAFQGDALALQHAVNPAWRGLTPYVALIVPGSAPRYYVGRPPAPAWQQFFGRR